MKFDTGLFIETVRSFPTLYDHQHPDYKDPAKKMKLWHEIAKNCGIVSGEAAKAKWRNVRDSYVKHLKSLKIGNPKRKYNSWPWSDRMEFLIPYVTGRQNLMDSMDTDQQSMYACKQEIWEDHSGEAILPDDMTQDHIVQNQHLVQQPEHMLHTNTHMRSFSSMDCLEGVKVELSDPTDLMMLSHARRIRGFSRKRQLQVEMKIAQLVMEAEMEEIEAEDERELTSTENQS